jgi:2-phospho-L-lactate guanylyltransferase
MLHDVLDVVSATGAFRERLIVSPDPGVLREAEERGYTPVPEASPEGMSSALGLGLRHCAPLGIDAAVLVPADLPLVTPQDLEAIAERLISPKVVLVPAYDGGTNLLGLRPLDGIRLRYEEPGSCRLHREEAREAGLPVEMVHLPRAEVDVDEVDDLSKLLRASVGGRTRDVVRGLLRRGVTSGATP